MPEDENSPNRVDPTSDTDIPEPKEEIPDRGNILDESKNATTESSVADAALAQTPAIEDPSSGTESLPQDNPPVTATADENQTSTEIDPNTTESPESNTIVAEQPPEIEVADSQKTVITDTNDTSTLDKPLDDKAKSKERSNHEILKQQEKDLDEKHKSINKEFSDRRITLHEVKLRRLSEYTEFFAPTESYVDLIDNLETVKDKHIFAITGPEDSGKQTTAINLANQLLKRNTENSVQSIWFYADKRTDQSFLNIVYDEKLPQNSVIIILEIFQHSLLSAGLDLSFAEYHEVLSRKNVYIIVTASVPNIEQITLLESIQYPLPPQIITTDNLDLEKVYTQFVKRFFVFPSDEELTILKSNAGNITKHYTTPNQLHRFFRWLVQNPELLKKEGVLTKNLTDLDKKVAREWFQELIPLNYRLYAIFVALFVNVKPEIVDDLYYKSVLFLRQEKKLTKDFKEPSIIGIYDLRLRTAVRESGPSLEFEDNFYKKLILEQTENYYWLLWSLKDYFADLIKKLYKSNDPFYSTFESQRELRDAIALVLAKIGVYRLDELKAILNDIVLSPHTFTAVATATILRPLTETGQYDEFVIELLDEWAKSESFDKKWATCVAISKIYSINEQQGTSESRHATLSTFLLTRFDEILSRLGENYKEVDFDAEADLLKSVIEDLVAASQNNLSPNELTERDKLIIVYRQRLFWQNQIRLTIVRTLYEISQIHINRANDLLSTWLKPESPQSLYELARMALNYIWQNSSRDHLTILNTKRFPFLLLLPSTLKASKGITTSGLWHILTSIITQESMEDIEWEHQRHVSELIQLEPVNTAVEEILSLYRSATELQIPKGNLSDKVSIYKKRQEKRDKGSVLWQEVVYGSLIKLIHQITPSERNRLSATLLYCWAEAEKHEEVIHHLLQAILSYAAILNGDIMFIPTTPYRGVVLIDSSSTFSDKDYLKSALQFIHQLSTKIPLDIHRLGDTTSSFTLTKDLAQKKDIVSLRDLRPNGQPKPCLIVPIINNHHHAYSPDTTLFILVFNLSQIIDIQDFLPFWIPPPSNRPVSRLKTGVSTQEQKEQYLWEWENKVFLQNQNNVTLSQRKLTHQVNRQLVGLTLQLTNLIIEAFNGYTLAQLRTDLANYIPSTFSDVPFEEIINKWLSQIELGNEQDNVEWARVTTYKFIIEAKAGNLDQVCSILIKWLMPANNDLHQIMSISITRTLIASYLHNSQAKREDINNLCQILPYFSKAIKNYDELTPVLGNFIRWASTNEKAEFVSNNKWLNESLVNLGTDKQHHLLEWLRRYNYLPLFMEIFSQLDKSFDEFRQLLDPVYLWCRENPNSIYKNTNLDLALSEILPLNQFNDLILTMQIWSRQDENHWRTYVDGDEIYSWLLLSITEEINLLAASKTIPAKVRYWLMVVESIKKPLQQQLSGSLPQLKLDNYYGLIIIDVTSKSAIGYARDLIDIFAAQIPENLELICHKLGSPEIVQHLNLEKQQFQHKNLSQDISRLASIGPTITRYALYQEQVAFVLIITEKQIVDYEDWLAMEDAVWVFRTWVMPVNDKWLPNRGEIIKVPDETEGFELADRIYEKIKH